MKKIFLKCFFSFLFVLLICPSLSFAKLKLYYGIYWGPFKLGEAQIEYTETYYKATVYTVGIGNFIYSYYAVWTTFVDKKGLPIKSEIYSKDRKKERKKIIKFKREKKQIIYETVLPEKGKPNSISCEFPVYDELSAFINSFFVNYKQTPFVKFPVVIKKERVFIEIKFDKEVKCLLKNGKRKKCMLLKVTLPPKSELLKRSKIVEVYLAKEERVPVILKGFLPIVGALKAKLDKIEKGNYNLKKEVEIE